MRIASIGNRVKLLVPFRSDNMLDVADISQGRFGPTPRQAFDDWEAFKEWSEVILDGCVEKHQQSFDSFDPSEADAPSPEPRQVFAVAFNYAAHAEEAATVAPGNPLYFTKFVSSFSGPRSTVPLPAERVDWEVELVAVIGQKAANVSPTDGWNYVAGLTVGQDLSERGMQLSGPYPQFSLAKSHPGFSPQGPVLVTPDEFENPDDLLITCELNGETVQSARTSQMVFSVPELVANLSEVVTLYPGDVIFTGTPAGVGLGREPQMFLKPGDTLRSWVEQIGELHQVLV